jgi:hypothetical protein
MCDGNLCHAMLCCAVQGFMRIQRNHGKHGKCALASYPSMVFRKPLPDGPSTPMRSEHVQPEAAVV